MIHTHTMDWITRQSQRLQLQTALSYAIADDNSDAVSAIATASALAPAFASWNNTYL